LLGTVNPGADGYSGTTYVYTGTITFDGILDGDDHFFLAADTNNNLSLYDNGQDTKQPMTTSGVGTPVPEPSTIALLGIGLIGLVGSATRKRLKKTNKQ
jgi:hypothetical protein